MEYAHITVEPANDGRVVHVTLGPPPGNIVTAAVVDELDNALEHANGDPACRLVVIRGAGDHFSYGASVDEHRPEKIQDMLPRFHAFIGRLIDSPVPTLAAVSGLCLGGGFEVALSCSLLFCDDSAKMGVPEIELGVFPPVASVLLPLRVGEARANRAVLTGEKLDAATANSWGLVSGVCPRGKLDATVREFIERRILPRSPSSLRIANRAVRSDTADHYRRHIADLERLYLDRLMQTSDAAEGIAAFLEKRKPRWENP